MPIDIVNEYFCVPREVYFGPGTIKALKEEVKGEKAFIVTDELMTEINHVEKVRDMLEEGGKDVEVYTGAEPNPPRYCVEKAVDQVKEFEPDLIIGLGGGSSIDAAKAIWFFYEYPDKEWEDFLVIGEMPDVATKKDRKADFVAIPTTSGTGTEMTLASVITDTSQDPPVKEFPLDYEITPNAAILDPELTKTMPPNVTANTGMDALSHAIEGLVGKGRDPLTDALNFQGTEMIFEWLPKAYARGDNIDARMNMHLASGMIGMGFSNSAIGMVHATGHQLLAFDVPHGKAMATMMPYVIEFNSLAEADRYAEIARRLGAEFEGAKEGTKKLIGLIEELKTDINEPLSIQEIDGISKDDFYDELDKLVENASNDWTLDNNPRDATEEDLRGIFERAWKGEKIL